MNITAAEVRVSNLVALGERRTCVRVLGPFTEQLIRPVLGRVSPRVAIFSVPNHFRHNLGTPPSPQSHSISIMSRQSFSLQTKRETMSSVLAHVAVC